ncbi:MAG: hypothetical protein RLZZ458_61 [Planctomycetota bacterium]
MYFVSFVVPPTFSTTNHTNQTNKPNLTTTNPHPLFVYFVYFVVPLTPSTTNHTNHTNKPNVPTTNPQTSFRVFRVFRGPPNRLQPRITRINPTSPPQIARLLFVYFVYFVVPPNTAASFSSLSWSIIYVLVGRRWGVSGLGSSRLGRRRGWGRIDLCIPSRYRRGVPG